MRRHAATALAALAVAYLAACGGGIDSPPIATDGDQPATTPDSAPRTDARTDDAREDDTADDETIASVRGLELELPAPGAVLVAFHEGASVARELEAELPTRAVMNSGASTTVSTQQDRDTVAAMVLPSRRRAAGATTAVDVVLPPSVEVLAPVTGRVVEAERYSLYGRHTDVKIVIAPDDHPDLRVVMLHVTDPAVRPGDEVEAGRTRLARGARSLPVTSQVDRFTVRSWVEDPPPHVHLEVRPA